MPAQRSGQSATMHTQKPERILCRATVKLRRVRQYGGAEHGKTLMFSFDGGTRRAQRSRMGDAVRTSAAPYRSKAPCAVCVQHHSVRKRKA